jgi:hypothetical protein
VAIERGIKGFFDRYATVAFENFPVGVLRDAPRALEGGR